MYFATANLVKRALQLLLNLPIMLQDYKDHSYLQISKKNTKKHKQTVTECLLIYWEFLQCLIELKFHALLRLTQSF